MEKIKKINVFKLVIICVCILCFVGLMLPYQSATKDYKEDLQKYPDQINIQGIKLTNKDVINISIIENLRLYTYGLDTINNGDASSLGLGGSVIKGEFILNIVLIIVLIVSSALVLLFAIFNRRVLSIIFSLVLLGSSLLMNIDAVARGAMPSSSYTYGISYYLYPIMAILMIISTIILIVKNKKEKNK